MLSSLLTYFTFRPISVSENLSFFILLYIEIENVHSTRISSIPPSEFDWCTQLSSTDLFLLNLKQNSSYSFWLINSVQFSSFDLRSLMQRYTPSYILSKSSHVRLQSTRVRTSHSLRTRKLRTNQTGFMRESRISQLMARNSRFNFHFTIASLNASTRERTRRN